MSDSPLLNRLTADGPKRVLTLDGGGVRGTLGLGYLIRLEAMLQEWFDRPEFRLRDYFDLICGTSTGAIIAAALAVGWRATEVRDLYLQLATTVFGARHISLGRKLLSRTHLSMGTKARFDARVLEGFLRRSFGDRLLGDASITTGLCLISKRADTRSTWPLLNHPLGRYYSWNASIRLCDAVRASTAAPTFFVPVRLQVAPDGEEGAFIDGGVSMANNPALQAFLVATLSGYPFRWKTGEHDLLLVSLGTGTWSHRDDVRDVMNRRLWNWTLEVPSMLMDDANAQTQLILQLLSRTRTPWVIDREVGDLSEDYVGEPALTYLRYDVALDANGLNSLGFPELAARAESLRDMSSPENAASLAAIGEAAAAAQLQNDHFPTAFDV